MAPPELTWSFGEQTADADRYAVDIDGRRLTVSFPRLEHMDYGEATWTAYWEDEHRAGVDRTCTGEMTFKHHITAYDVGLVIPTAAALAARLLPGVQSPSA